MSWHSREKARSSDAHQRLDSRLSFESNSISHGNGFQRQMGADFAFSIMFLRTHVVKYLKRLVKPTSQDENQPDWSRSDSREEEEHLIDVMNTDGEVKVIALLPSIQKEDIRIHCAEDTLTISVETPQRRYYKEIGLPAKVNPEKAETSYKNCVLEVTLPKKTGVRSIGNTFDM